MSRFFVLTKELHVTLYPWESHNRIQHGFDVLNILSLGKNVKIHTMRFAIAPLNS